MVSTILRSAIVIILVSTSVAAQWSRLPNSGTGDLIAVYFTSEREGWVAGDNGYLASTTDGGRTWKPYNLSATEDINEIYFRNEKNGYLVAGKKMST